MSKFLILLDYRNNFLVSIEDLHHYTSMDVDKLCMLLTKNGHTVEKNQYSNLDLKRSYSGYYVLYQSSEDIGLFYKDYVEDIVYYLERQGAFLLPGFDYFLAHHNKNFMELLRNNFHDEDLKTIHSQLFGTAEESINKINEFPVVIKSAEGSGSRGVFLARNLQEYKNIVNKLSGAFLINRLSDILEFLIYIISLKLFNKVQSKFRSHTFYRKKFIVQNFIGGLDGDYKVLFFGGKYYALYRKNRDNDFRASGGGKLFEVSENEILPLLEFCRKLTLEVDFPIIGMDVGFDGKEYHLLEFQCIHIGPYALQCSEYWYEYDNGAWIKTIGKSSLEEEFCRSILAYIQKFER